MVLDELEHPIVQAPLAGGPGTVELTGEVSKAGGLGSEVWITVTTPEEARTAAEAGAEALVCQGTEAGGHQASFEDTEGQVGFGVLALLRLVAAEVDLPLVAAGGIADGPGVAAA